MRKLLLFSRVPVKKFGKTDGFPRNAVPVRVTQVLIYVEFQIVPAGPDCGFAADCRTVLHCG